MGLLIEDMLERIDRVARYTIGLDRDAFVEDEKTVDAVVRSFEVIGEAARRLPGEFKAGHNEIPWHQIAGLRNRIVHEYFDVDLGLVWEIATTELPKLKASLRRLQSSG
ncbi:MAG TPA: DUF86 domain-containing protein [Candidatus Acidoferrum sp.]|nr:DUF86 domain-containing protein [Candidatus Acidoferrum sp.]